MTLYPEVGKMYYTPGPPEEKSGSAFFTVLRIDRDLPSEFNTNPGDTIVTSPVDKAMEVPMPRYGWNWAVRKGLIVPVDEVWWT